jgi:hypothetical protein
MAPFPVLDLLAMVAAGSARHGHLGLYDPEDHLLDLIDRHPPLSL